MLATLNNAWKRSASGVMAASTMAKAIRPAASSTIAMVALDAVEDMTNYFSTLRPYNPPSTPSAYNHMDSEKIVQDFFRQIENKAMIMSTIEGQAPTTPIQSIMDESDDTNVMHMTSVLRKRKIKMRKHKYKKLRKRTRALRKKLGK
ncbi:hypothetical protein KI688_012901 [Linnemannia hyalina]|uniref:Small ribosomal subunit protein mS38 n=1 Tax=Linnemannia hyalina TaxID=64524 RepID=A0A9P7XW47_9FUNG|nr:hypothetical protein KI688_012901 [Linnemannia hyalina]